MALALGSAVEAAPSNGRVVQGSGSIERSGTHTDIHQRSDFLATRWDSFNIAAHESVQAHQPNSTSRLLIRVDGGGGGATNIAGSYTSNGITILENQNGVQFSRGAIVNVGGLLATSSRISGVAGAHWQLNGVGGGGGGAVVNHGQIVAGAGGAILAAVKVQNTGDITAKGGDVALGAGSSFTVDFAGSMVGFEVTKPASGASIVNTGKIESQGGIVSLSAHEAQAVRTNVVSVGGVVRATKMARRGGVVYLSGGDEGIAEVSGDVQADEKIQMTGEYVVVKEDAVLTAPEILVGGDYQGKGDVPTARRTLVERGALLDAGQNGRVIVWSDETTWFDGRISAPGGFAEVSGKKVLASVNLSGIDVGHLLLDPEILNIVAVGDDVTGDIAADASSADGTTNISVGSINNFTGASLTLSASRSVRVRSAISHANLNLTLRTENSDGAVEQNIELGADIDVGTGTLSLESGLVTIPLVAGAAVIRTLTASGLSTSSISGLIPSSIHIRFTRAGVVGLAEGFAGGFARVAFGAEVVRVGYSYGARASEETATDCSAQEINCTIGRINENVMATSARLTSANSITINIGTGNLDFTNAPAGDIVIDSGSVSIKAGGILIGARGLTIIASVGNLTLNTSITGTGLDNAVSLSSVNGDLILGSQDKGVDFALEGRALTLNAGGEFVFVSGAAPSAITAQAIELSGPNLPQRTPSASVITLTPRPNGRVTGGVGAGALPLWFANNLDQPTQTDCSDQPTDCTIRRGGRDLEISTENLTATSSITIDIEDGTLTFSGAGAIAISARDVALTAAMINLDGRDLTITGGGATLDLNLNTDITAANTLTFGEVNESFTLTLDAARTLAGANISFLSVDEITVNHTLRLHSTNRLVLTSNIDAQGAASDLTLGLGGMIVLQDTGEVELASDGNLTIGGEITTEFALLLDANGFLVLNADIVNTGDDIRLISTRGIILNGDRLVQNDSRNVFVRGEIDDSSASGLNLAANDSLTIKATGVNSQILFNANVNLGTGALSLTSTRGFQRETPHITFTGGDITIPRSFTNNGVTRSFTVMASGTLTLNGTTYSAPDSITLSGTQGIVLGSQNTQIASSAITITAPTLNSNSRNLTITGGGSALTLNLNANITNADTITLGEANHSLTLIPDATRTLAGAHISLLSSTDISVQQSLSLHSGTTLTLNVPLLETKGEGHHLTLGSSGTISVMGTGSPIFRSVKGNLTIRAALTGPTLTGLFLIANTSELVLNADITGGSFLLTLEANRITLSGSRSIEADGGIFLNGMIDESGERGNDSLTLTSGGAVTLRREINLGTGDLTITAGGAALTLNLNADIKNAGTITIGEADQRLFLTLDAARTLTSTNIMLLSSTGISVQQSLHLHASGTLTLAAQISTTSGNDLTLGSPEMEPETEPDTAPDTAPDTESETETETETGMISLTHVAFYQFNAGGKLTINNALIDAPSVIINLTATDSDGVIELNADITGTSASIFLDGPGGIVLNGDRTLEAAGTITLRGAINESGLGGSDSLTVNATNADARIFLGSDINLGAGHLTLTGMGGIMLESDIQLTGGDIELAGVIDESAAMADENGEGGNDGLTVTATGQLTLNNNINIGTGDLILNGGTISLNGDSGMSRIEIQGGTTTLTGVLTSTDNILVVIDGAVIRLNSDIHTGAGNLHLGAFSSMIILGGDITLTGRVVTIASAVDESAAQPDENGKGGEDSLTIVAGEFVTLFEDINLGAGTLTLISGPGHPAGSVQPTRLTLTASTVSIEQNKAFTSTFGQIITFMTNVLTLKTAAVQTVYGWMTQSDHDLKIIAGGDITIGGLYTPGIIDIGTSDLILDSATKIVLNEDATITGGAITLTGAIEGAGNSLTINARGMLTLNNDINLGAGDFMLKAHALSVPGAITITADPIVFEFTDLAIQMNNLPADIGMITFQGDTSPDYISVQSQTDCIVAICVLDWEEAHTPLSPDLDAQTSITINADKAATPTANDGRLMFSGTGAITINAPVITINASLIDTQGRQLTITTSGGALTLNADLPSSGGLVELTSMGGAIILGGGINAGTGGITLSGGTGIRLVGDTQLIGAAITLTGTIDESSSGNDGLTATATGALTLNSNIDTGTGNLILTGASMSLEGDNTTLTLRGGNIRLTGALTSTGPALIVQARDVLRLNNDINIGAEDILTLTGMGGITLGGALITLTGLRVLLTGAIDESAAQPDANGKGGGDSFTINASDDIDIDKNIDLGTGTLTLIAGTTSINGEIRGGSPIPTLSASEVIFTQDVAFDEAARFTFMTSALTLRTTAAQTVHVWMVAANRNLSLTTERHLAIVRDVDVGTGDLTLATTTSIALGTDITLMGGAITLTGLVNGAIGDRALTITATGQLTLNDNIYTGTGDLTLTGSSIELNEAGDLITLTGGAVSLTGAIDESGAGGNNNLTVNASGDITLNGDINLGTGALALVAGTGSSSGSIMNGGASRSLTAQSVSLTQDAAFASTGLFTFASTILLLDTGASQTVHAWMTQGDRALSLTSAITIRVEENVSTGTSDLTLTGDGITFSDGARTLSGANIALTGASTGMADLTILATGTLALNSSITMTGSASDLSVTGGVGGIIVGAGVEFASGHDLTISGAISVAGTNGDLTLTAVGTAGLGGDINLGTGTLMIGTGSNSGLIGNAVITAGTINIMFYNNNVASASDVAAIGTTITFANSVEPTYTFGAVDCKNHHPCVIEGVGEIVVQSTLTDITSITITATGEDSRVRFGGTGVITLTAPETVITAATIELEDRALMIVDPGGASLTIGGNIANAGAITLPNSGTLAFVGESIVAGGRIDIIAGMISTVDRADGTNTAAAHSLSITASEDLSLTVSAIDVGSASGGELNLGITGGTGSISAASAVDITASVVFLTHGSDNQTSMTSALLGSTSNVGTLNVNVNSADQETADWMFAVGRTIAITNHSGTLTVASAISHHSGAITLTTTNSTSGGINVFGNIINLAGGLTLNSGARPIAFGGTGVRKIIAAGITLSAGSITASSDLILEAGTTPLVLNSGIAAGANNLTLDGSVIDLSSSITLTGANIRLIAPISEKVAPFTFTVDASFTLTLDNNIDLGTGSLVLSGAGIALGGDITLEGMAITLTGAISETADDLSFTITAGDVVTLNSDIELTGDTGTEISITASGGEIMNGGSARTLTANRVDLVQSDEFSSAAPFIFSSVDRLNLTTNLTTGATQAQAVWTWMVNGNLNLSLTSTGAIEIRTDISAGVGSLVLAGASIALPLAGHFTLSGFSIELTGAIDADARGLTINASSRLTLNSDINLGTGALAIIAERIAVPNMILMTASAITITFTGVGITSASEGFVGGQTSLDRVSFTPVVEYIFSEAELGCGDSVVCRIGNGTAALNNVSSSLSALSSITIDAGSNPLTFAGTDAITITAPTIEITASMINIGGRNLTITSAGGALTLNGKITDTSSSAVMLSATSTLTLGGNIDIRAGALTLSAGSIELARNITLTGASISLTGAIDESGAGGNDNFTVRLAAFSSGSLLISNDINLGTGNLVLLANTRDIMLGGAITLTGGDITLTGQIDQSGLNRNFTANASNMLTLNDDIDVGSNGLVLSGASGILLIGNITLASQTMTITAPMIDSNGSNLTLTGGGGGGGGGGALTLNLNADITDSHNLTIGQASQSLTLNLDAARTLESANIMLLSSAPISVARALELNYAQALTLSSDLSTTGIGNDLTLGSGSGSAMTISLGAGTRTLASGGALVIGGAINSSNTLILMAGGALMLHAKITLIGVTSPSLTLTGSSITLNDVTLLQAAGSVELTGAIDDPSGNENLTIIAGGDITINSDINLGTGRLVLAAGSGSSVGDINNGGAARVLTAQSVSFKQDGSFAVLAPFTFVSVGTLNLSTSSAQTLHDWMTDGARALSLTASGTIRVERDVSTGTGSLTLKGINIANGGAVRALTASTVSLTQGIAFGESALFTFVSVGTLNLTTTSTQPNATLMVQAWMTQGSHSLSLTSAGSIMVGEDVSTGAGDLTLEGDAITFSGGARTLSGVNISLIADTITHSGQSLTITATGALTTAARDDADGAAAVPAAAVPSVTASLLKLTQAGAFGTSAPFVFVSVGALDLNTDAVQEVHSWMIAPNRNLAITSALDVNVAAAIGTGVLRRDLGAGNLTLTSTSGFIRVSGDITTSGNIILDGSTGIDLSGGARVFRGVDLTLTGAATSDEDVRVVITGLLTLNGDIDTGANALTLRTKGGAIRIVGGETDANTGMRTLTGGTVTLGAHVGGVMVGRFDSEGVFLTDGPALEVEAIGQVRIAGDIMTGSDVMLTGGGVTPIMFANVRTLSAANIMLNNPAFGTADLTLTASGTLTVNNNITLTGASSTLALRSSVGAIGNGGGLRTLTAATVSFEQVDAFSAARTFSFANVGSLEFTTEAEQEVHNWMINRDRNLTITSALDVNVTAAIGAGVLRRDLGAGNLTLTSRSGYVRVRGDITTSGNIILDGSTGIDLSGGARVFRGVDLTLTGAATSDEDVRVVITGLLTLNGDIDTGANALTLRTKGGAIRIVGGETDANTGTRTLTGGTVTLGAHVGGIMVGRFDSEGVFLTDGPALEVEAIGQVRIAGDIMTGSDVMLTGGGVTPIMFANVRTLSAANIMLNNPAFGTADLTLTASGTLTVNNNITLTGASSTLALRSSVGAIGNGGGLRTLTAATVSFAQVDAFSAARTFSFANVGSLEFTTEAEQEVHNWMINRDRNLTITSALDVNVTAAIGAGVLRRDLGAGALILTSTTRFIRISGDIMTSGHIALRGAGPLNDIRFTDVGRVLSGTDIMLTGDVSVSAALTITATGLLTFNSGMVDTDTGDLTLTGAEINILSAPTGSNSGTRVFRGGDITFTAAGGVRVGYIDGNEVVFTGGPDLKVEAEGTLTIAADITTRDAITLQSGAGAIGNGGSVRTLSILSAGSEITLRQADAFGATPLFEFGSIPTTLSLNVTGSGAQRIHDWMVAAVINGNKLVVDSLGRVLVDADIDLGASAITLISRESFVRVRGNITTSGNIALSGAATLENPAIRFDRAARTISGGDILLTGNVGISSADSGDSGVNIAITASGALRINGNDINIGTSNLALTGSGGILLIRALTLTGRDIALTGDVLTAGDTDLTITANGTLTVNNNITLTGASSTLALRSSVGAIGNGGTVRTLTAATVSFAQVDAFSTARTFSFANVGSLEFTTEAEQEVHNWMITRDRNLTITSALDVNVGAPIGAGVLRRDLGAGALILTSRSGYVRAREDILTSGDMIFNSPRGVDLSGGARTLRGADITFNGRTRSNGARLDITATGVLTINQTITTRNPASSNLGALSLTGAVINVAGASGVTRNLVGGDITLTSAGGVMLGGAAGESFSTERNLAILKVVSRGVLTIAADIVAGTNALTGGDVMLTGDDGIVFMNERTLNASTLMLNSPAVGTSNLTIIVREFLLGNEQSTIDVGANTLTIEAGRDLPASLTGSNRLQAGSLSLSFDNEVCPATVCVER